MARPGGQGAGSGCIDTQRGGRARSIAQPTCDIANGSNGNLDLPPMFTACANVSLDSANTHVVVSFTAASGMAP